MSNNPVDNVEAMQDFLASLDRNGVDTSAIRHGIDSIIENNWGRELPNALETFTIEVKVTSRGGLDYINEVANGLLDEITRNHWRADEGMKASVHVKVTPEAPSQPVEDIVG